MHIEILALRHQLAVLQRRTNKRPSLRTADRLLWVMLLRFWSQWRSPLVIVKPETVIGWQRKGFRLYWRWKSRAGKSGRPFVSREIRELIRQMSTANPLWGAPRIHGELLKLGIQVSQATVAKYMVRQPFLLLTIGVNSAIAVTVMQTGVLARPVPLLYTMAQSEDEIDEKNWQKHPKIIAIRRTINSANTEVRIGAFKTEHRICEEGWFSRLRIARDSNGTVRWNQHYQEGEDSSWDDNFYYDVGCRLRFGLMTSYASTAHENSIAHISMKVAISSTMVAGSSREDTLALQSKI